MSRNTGENESEVRLQGGGTERQGRKRMGREKEEMKIIIFWGGIE